jgi:hypothetical protein
MVDVSDGNNKSVDDKYGTPRHNSLPFTVILDSDGKQLLTQNIAFADEDALSHGTARVAPDKVLDILKKWAPKRTPMPPNKSPEPTAVGAFRSAVAVRVVGRRWLGMLL